MRLARLRRMSLGELAVRSRQEATRWLDRIGPADGRVRRAAFTGPRHRPSSHAFASFFDGASDEASPRWCPRECREPRRDPGRRRVDLEGRFDLLGYRGLSFGRPIDWHSDPCPVVGARAALEPARSLDPEQVGDSKVLWELGACSGL